MKNKKYFITICIMLTICVVGCGGSDIKKSKNTQKKKTVETKTSEPKQYEKYLTEDEYADDFISDITKWKKDGEYCYPAGYEVACVPGDEHRMAAQQFPPQLIEEMDTESLLDFIMQDRGDISILAYDRYSYAFQIYRDNYNFIDAFLEREDAESVVKHYYQRYSDQEIQTYSKTSRQSTSDIDSQSDFQLIEGMLWYFMDQRGEEVPDKNYW